MKIAITSNKGGCAKTISTINIGGALLNKGYKVLVVDLDNQANLTTALTKEQAKYTTGNLLLSESSFKETVIKTESGIDLIPSSSILNKHEKQIASEAMYQFLLKKALRSVKSYDFILFDCPPSTGVLTVNALMASDGYIVPTQATKFSVDGVKTVVNLASKIGEHTDLVFLGAFLTRFNKNTNKILHREVYKALQQTLADKLMQTTIRENIALDEAILSRMTIQQYDPTTNGATDYNNLTEELLNRIKNGC
jgi:chromosome partitioning protein